MIAGRRRALMVAGRAVATTMATHHFSYFAYYFIKFYFLLVGADGAYGCKMVVGHELYLPLVVGDELCH